MNDKQRRSEANSYFIVSFVVSVWSAFRILQQIMVMKTKGTDFMSIHPYKSSVDLRRVVDSCLNNEMKNMLRAFNSELVC